MSHHFNISKIEIFDLEPVSKQKTVLHFNPKEVLLLGSNGAGKTSILRLIQSLRVFDFTDFFVSLGVLNKPYSLHIEYEANFLNYNYKVTLKESAAHIKKNDISSQQLAKFATEDLKLNIVKNYYAVISNDKGHVLSIEVDNIGCRLKNENGEILSHNSFSDFSWSSDEIAKVNYSIILANLNNKSKSPEMDESLGALVEFGSSQRGIFFEGDNYYHSLISFSSIYYSAINGNNVSSFSYASGGGPFSRLFPFSNNASDVFYDFVKNAALKSDELIIIDRSNLKVVDDICNFLKFKNLKFNFIQSKKEKADSSLHVNWSLQSIKVVVSDEEEFDSSRLSYGQKRFISLCFYLAEKTSDPLLIDEPTNGLHHTFVDQFYFGYPKSQQLFMTTQSPWLLEYLEAESQEDVLTKFVLCAREDNAFEWRNFSEKEAKIILKSKSNNLMRIDEILRSKDLW